MLHIAFDHRLFDNASPMKLQSPHIGPQVSFFSNLNNSFGSSRIPQTLSKANYHFQIFKSFKKRVIGDKRTTSKDKLTSELNIGI